MASNVDDFIAGWVSGAVATVLTQPFDMAVTRIQAGKGQAPLTQLRLLMRLDYSVGAAWRGVGPLLILTPFNNALIFLGYGAGKRFAATGDESSNSLLPIFLGGCAGGFAQSFTTSPFELLKVRMQLAEPKTPGTAGASGASGAAGLVGSRGFATASAIVKELTVVGHSHTLPPLLSQGLLATLARDVVPHGVWFASYEAAKTAMTPKRPPAPPPALDGTAQSGTPPLSTGRQLAAGAIAAVAAWGVGYPFDIIKTRCQMSATSEGFIAAAQQVWREGGLAAMYRGFGLKMCRSVPMSAIGFLVYEHTYSCLRRTRGASS